MDKQKMGYFHFLQMAGIRKFFIEVPVHSGAALYYSAKIKSEIIPKFCHHCFRYALGFSEWYELGHITKNFQTYEYNCKAN